MMQNLVVLLALLTLVACHPEADEAAIPADTSAHTSPAPPAAAPQPTVAERRLMQDSLLGAWSTDGENFVWVIQPATILFEVDMQEHPYRISGDTLLIDRQDPTIGIQKTRVLRLAGDTMVIQDVLSGTSETLLRLE